MTNPTLTISIDRTSLSLPPLEFAATRGATTLGIVGYQPPARQMRVTYAPDSINIHGSEALAASWQQAILGWDWIRPDATESQVQASYDEVVAALSQFSYTVTTQISGASAEAWACDPGSVVPSARSHIDLMIPGAAVFAVTIPVYPIPAEES